MADEVRIGTPRQRTTITQEGTFEDYLDVEFFIGDARYTVEIPAAEFTPEAAEELVKKKATEILAIKGKKISSK